MFVALLMAGCGGDGNSGSDSSESNQSSAEPRNSDGNASVEPPLVVEEWAEWKANPKPYGGSEALERIRRAKGKGVIHYQFHTNALIHDFSPFGVLRKLKTLYIYTPNPIPEEQKAMLKKTLTNCKIEYVVEWPALVLASRELQRANPFVYAG